MLEGENGEVIIRLEGVIAHTNHGVTEAEQELGQRMIFDLEMEPIDCGATETDDVEDTVDYGEVTAWLVESGDGTPATAPWRGWSPSLPKGCSPLSAFGRSGSGRPSRNHRCR